MTYSLTAIKNRWDGVSVSGGPHHVPLSPPPPSTAAGAAAAPAAWRAGPLVAAGCGAPECTGRGAGRLSLLPATVGPHVLTPSVHKGRWCLAAAALSLPHLTLPCGGGIPALPHLTSPRGMSLLPHPPTDSACSQCCHSTCYLEDHPSGHSGLWSPCCWAPLAPLHLLPPVHEPGRCPYRDRACPVGASPLTSPGRPRGSNMDQS